MNTSGATRLSWMLPSVAIVAIAVVFVQFQWFPGGNGPALVGTRVADLGVVAIDDVPVTVEHHFKLENTSSRALVIDRVSSSCGCLSAEAMSDTVVPGETLTVVGRMALDAPGVLQATIWVYVVGDAQPVALTMHAEGSVPTSIQPLVEELRFARDEQERDFSIQFVSQDGVGPGEPRVTIEDGWEVRVGDWESIPQGRKALRRWQVRVTVLRRVETTHDALVHFELPDHDLAASVLIRVFSSS